MAQKNKSNPFDMMQDIAMTAVSDEKVLRVSNELCFALYVCSKEIIRKMRSLLDNCGITYTGYITLAALLEKDGMNVKELGGKICLDSGTLTPLLRKLEAKGYVVRLKDRHDERNIRICLTASGKELTGRLVSLPKEVLSSAGINGVKAYLLMQSLQPLIDGLSEQEGEKAKEEPESSKQAALTAKKENKAKPGKRFKLGLK